MTMTRRELMFGAMGAVSLSVCPALAGTTQIGGPAFGSSWRATVDATVDTVRMQHLIQSIITNIDGCLSPYLPESGLSRFNAARTSAWQPVHPMLEQVSLAALLAAQVTEGYFDPSVGPLVARQGFGPISGRTSHYTLFETKEGLLRKHVPDATLDLCGIAKGFALDRIVQALNVTGIGRVIVDVGGEVKALGAHPDGRDWAVAIADPQAQETARCIVAPRGYALATSGHAANGVRGRASTSHIIDPHRKAAALQPLRSVSVLHRSAIWADALATALCAAGPVIGPKLARRLDLSAFFILDDAAYMTGGFETHVLI